MPESFEYQLKLDSTGFVAPAQAAAKAEADVEAGAKTMAAALKEATAAVNPWTTAAKSAAADVSALGEATKQAGNAAVTFGPPVKGFGQFLNELSAGRAAAAATREAAGGVEEMGKSAGAHAPKVRTLGDYMREIPSLGKAAGAGSRDAGLGLMLMGQMADDAEYGLMAVRGQIPGLIMALGGSAGLAGAVQLGTIALGGMANMLAGEYKKAWDDMVGNTAYDKLLARNEQLVEQHDRMLASLRAGAGQKGDREAEGAAAGTGYDKQHRAMLQERFDAKKAELALEHDIARAKLDSLKGAEKAIALNALEKEQAAQKLEMERQFYAERLANLKNATGMTGNRHEDEKRLRQLQEEQRELALKPDDAKSEKEKRRAAELPGAVQAERTRVDSARAAFDAESAALRKVESEQGLLGRRGQLGDMRTQRVVDDERKKAEDETFRKHDEARKRQLEDPRHADNRAQAESERTDKLKSEAERRGVDTTKNGWALKLRDSIVNRPGPAGGDEGDDDDEDGGAPRSGRGRSAGRIRGVIAPGSYQRDRSGRRVDMGLRASRELQDPRIAARGRPSGEQQLSPGEKAILKTLTDIYRETRKQNSPKKA